MMFTQILNRFSMSVLGVLLFFTYCRLQQNLPVHIYTNPQFGFHITCPDSGWTLSDITGIREVMVYVHNVSSKRGTFI